MKWVALLILFIGTFYAGYFGMSVVYSKFGQSKVLAWDSEKISDPSFTPALAPTLTEVPTPSFTPTPTSTTLPTANPTDTPAPTPTLLALPVASQQEIHALMERFAGQYGVDVNILRHIATCESGFNSAAVNGPYAGLYQFNTSVWKNYRQIMGEDANPDLRFNAEEAIQTAAYLIANAKRQLWPNCYP